MERTLTLLVQVTIEANTSEQFEKKRDKIIGKLEDAGWCVSVEDEGDDEFIEEMEEDLDGEDFYCPQDDDDEEEKEE